MGVTEYPPGPHLAEVTASLVSGAVILALDVSGSMEKHMEAAIRGGQDFLDEAVSGGYHVGVLLWDHEVVGFAPPVTDPAPARQLLAGADSRGGTNIVPALMLAHAELMRLAVPDRVLAVFGDGQLGKREKAEAASARLVSDGIRIVTCGLGPESADALAVISTERIEPRTASVANLSASIAGMATGLQRRARTS